MSFKDNTSIEDFIETDDSDADQSTDDTTGEETGDGHADGGALTGGGVTNAYQEDETDDDEDYGTDSTLLPPEDTPAMHQHPDHRQHSPHHHRPEPVERLVKHLNQSKIPDNAFLAQPQNQIFLQTPTNQQLTVDEGIAEFKILRQSIGPYIQVPTHTVKTEQLSQPIESLQPWVKHTPVHQLRTDWFFLAYLHLRAKLNAPISNQEQEELYTFAEKQGFTRSLDYLQRILHPTLNPITHLSELTHLLNGVIQKPVEHDFPQPRPEHRTTRTPHPGVTAAPQPDANNTKDKDLEESMAPENNLDPKPKPKPKRRNHPSPSLTHTQ